MGELYVRDVMTRGVWCVPPDATVGEVASRMRAEMISCMLVTEGNRPLGVISERDLVRVLDVVLDNGAVGLLASDVMSSPIVSTTPKESVFDAMLEMLGRKIRRLVVVDTDGTLLGIVTQSDLLRAQLVAMESRAEALSARVTQRTLDLVEATERLKESNRLRGEFLATMSHEIRTPLNGILGTVALLLDGDLTSEQREPLETIANSGEALLAILNDVLDLSKIDAGELRIDHSPFDLRSVADNVARLLRARAAERGNEITVKTDDDLPVVVGDAVRVRQIVQNFVGNAIKFTENGWIDIAISSEPAGADRVRVGMEVRDTGMGMKQLDVEKIFMPYKQADGDDAQTRAKGTGLGLTICRRLVDMMGGEIGVRSKRGVGSVFWVTLVMERGTLALAEERANRRFDGVSVLLVEDDPVSRRIGVRTLERVGCEVVQASNGLEAVQLMAERRFDVAFMDCEMPVLDGYEATAEVRRREAKRDGAQYIVAMTGHALSEDRERCLAAGMNGYITKPATRDDLLGVLAEAEGWDRRGAA